MNGEIVPNHGVRRRKHEWQRVSKTMHTPMKANHDATGRARAPVATRPVARRRGFTLLEALMASGILLIAVIAVTSAVTAGQHHALEAKLHISGSIAAEELMGRLQTVAYSDLISNWDGFEEAPGEMETMSGEAYPRPFDRIGRRISITTSIHAIQGINVKVHGLTVEVEAFDDRGVSLVTIRRFIPQPQHETLSDIDDDEEVAAGEHVRDLLEDLGGGAVDLPALLDANSGG